MREGRRHKPIRTNERKKKLMPEKSLRTSHSMHDQQQLNHRATAAAATAAAARFEQTYTVSGNKNDSNHTYARVRMCLCVRRLNVIYVIIVDAEMYFDFDRRRRPPSPNIEQRQGIVFVWIRLNVSHRLMFDMTTAYQYKCTTFALRHHIISFAGQMHIWNLVGLAGVRCIASFVCLRLVCS